MNTVYRSGIMRKQASSGLIGFATAPPVCVSTVAAQAYEISDGIMHFEPSRGQRENLLPCNRVRRSFAFQGRLPKRIAILVRLQ